MLSLFLMLTAAGTTPSYDVTVLPGPLTAGNTLTLGQALNEHGQVAGAGFESGWFFGLVWADPDGWTVFSDELGWETAEACGIADDGTFVGTAAVNPSTEKTHAFVARLFLGSYRTHFLPQLVNDPNAASVACDVTENGLVAGWSDTVAWPGTQPGNPQTRAVLWKGGVPRNLGTLGGDVSWATGLNSGGVVVGVSNSSPGTLVHAFRWTAELGMERLAGFDPVARTWAQDVSEAGWIAGDADSGATRFAVLWPQPDHFVVLPHLAGDSWSEAVALNEHGLVVGRGFAPGAIHARLWASGVPHDLNAIVGDPRLELYGAVDVNDAGQILAHAFDKTTDPWRTVPVLLTPR